MSGWMLWFAAAGALVVLEMFSGTFYLLMVAIGLVVGGATALAGLDSAMQFLLAAATGILATAALHRSRWGRAGRPASARNPDINLDIGQTLVVHAWSSDGKTARSEYRGAAWDIELEPGSQPLPGKFVIREVRGSRLVVANSQ
jgi:membrane protein implicated in regulation of membrane protease activity